jgi:TRAP-type C4-dicarboxylate transport system permease small subunit
MKLVDIQFFFSECSRWLETVLLVICGLLLFAMASSVFYEVLIRYVFNAPTAWTEEIAEFILIWYGLLAAAVGARKGIHFAMRWGVIAFSDRTRWILRQAINIAVMIYLAVLVRLGLDYLGVVADQTSPGADLNMQIPWAGIPVGLGAILAMYLFDLADAFLSLWTGKQFSVREAREAEIYRALRGGTPRLSATEATE